MNKILLFLCLPLIGISQDSETKWVYAEIIGPAKIMSGRVKATIDYGELSAWAKDEKNKDLTFDSMVDAMNYLSKDGWEFCQANNNQEPPIIRWIVKVKGKLDNKGNLVPIYKVEK